MSDSKDLIIDVIPFKPGPEQINESVGANGTMIVQGVLQRAEKKNQNGRRYPKKILAREAEKYEEQYIEQNRAMGELDHPDSSVVNLKNVSHNIKDIWWDGKELKGEVEILTTPSGNILRELLKSGITLGISSRGLGSIKELRDGTVEVQEDFELIAWDFVSNPSTHGAFMKPKEAVNENADPRKKKEIKKYQRINNILGDIFQYAGSEPNIN